MADYKGIKGFTIPNVSSDPDNPIQGQIWYNSTSATLKGALPGVGAWASGGNLNTQRYAQGLGIQTAALTVSGAGSPSSPSLTAIVEQYDGSSWTEIADVNTARTYGGACGTTTAGLYAGGAEPEVGNTEEYNGSAWSEVNDLNTARTYVQGDGVQTAMFLVGGYASSTNQALVESYNGTSWTETTDINTARRNGNDVGSTTANLIIGGKISSNSALCELWNGTSWTEVGDLNLARAQLGAAGTSSLAVAYGGATGPTAGSYTETETWNGTAWTEVADLATARQGGSASGASQSSALYAGGSTDGGSTQVTSTEEWNKPDSTTVTVTTS